VKGFNRAQRIYDNMTPYDFDECNECMEGSCEYHSYYRYIWIDKVTTHRARKDDLDNGIKAGDLYRASYLVGCEVNNGVKVGIKEYKKRSIE